MRGGGTSQAVQRLRLHLPVQGMRVPSLVRDRSAVGGAAQKLAKAVNQAFSLLASPLLKRYQHSTDTLPLCAVGRIPDAAWAPGGVQAQGEKFQT